MANADKFDFGEDLGGSSNTQREAGSISGTDGSTGPNNGTAGGSESAQIGADPTTFVKKRRGRQPWPRDAAGNIIRPAGSEAASQAGKGKAKLAVDFTPNDRTKVQNNISAIHGLAAAATKQPFLMLRPDEALAMTNAVADVLDFHKINITGAGGVYGLYATLLITGFMIYKPRLDYIKAGGGVQVEQAAAPATPGDAVYASPTGKVDLSGDIPYGTEQTIQ